MASSIPIERRRFVRVDFDAETTVVQAGNSYAAQLLDISLKGALVKMKTYEAIDEQPATLYVDLTNGTHIKMQATLMHREQEYLGFHCDTIDVDSAAHLRRLLEINLNSPDAAERVLGELLEPADSQAASVQSSATGADKRRSLRVQLRAEGSLNTLEGSCDAHLINLSEGGAMVAVIDPHSLKAGDAVWLRTELPNGIQVTMEGRVAHVNEHMLGLSCTATTEEDAAQIKAAVARLAAEADNGSS